MIEAHAVFGALADPTRLRILLLVRELELAMGELAEVLGQSQPRVSRHVRILAEAGLVRRHREGAWVFVRAGALTDSGRLLAFASELFNGEDPILADRARLAQVRADRQRLADAWFAEHADEWDHMRALQGDDGATEARLSALARARGIGRLLDIGTGTARVLALLAEDAEAATGIDRSPEMLRLARAKLDGLGLGHVEVRQADMAALPFAAASFDTVVMHQVLHFAADPQAAIREAARVLAPDGQLILVDYARHDHEELRARFRHLRLGFASADIVRWLRDAGLRACAEDEQAGPALTVKLWQAVAPGAAAHRQRACAERIEA
jgi:ubiquinone/menaquinone biosynthesis C-methylase UbiE